uniref:5'-Nucleotidase C-terminal domain-containing protein n=1 Tax=Globisporangium ultimum (strain ATCC 200006 / CBS 805.95 / DAOM BR144) TaxID=431595 RepID=K3WNH8_GLOUD
MLNLLRPATLLVAALFATVSVQTTDAARNQTAIVDVIAFNDVYELLQDDVSGLKIGGPSRVIPIVQDMRKRNPNSLVLFAGDTMSPSLWSFQFKGMQMIDAHNALGVDYACLGNHEFDFGIDAFLNVSAASNFTWLNANCYEYETKALLRGTVPRAVKQLNHPEFGSIKIGFLGVMYDMKMPGNRLYWTDPIEAAKEQVKILRETEKVDFVIALTHQEIDGDNRFSTEVTGVDIIYGGHEHRAMLQTNFGTPYLKADLDFRTVWSSRLEYFAADTAQNLAATTRMTHRLIPITEEMPSDTQLDAVISTYAQRISELQSRQVGSLCNSLDLRGVSVRTMDTAVGNIFADSALHFYGQNFADVALINGGLIRSDTIYSSGPITLAQLIAWSPFGNTYVVFESDGASMKKFIEHEMKASCGSGFINSNGFYVQAGGIKYVFQCNGANNGALASIEWFNHPTRTGPVLDTDVFKLTVTNYVQTNEYLAVPGLTVTTSYVNEAEAGRVDSALEQFMLAQPNATLCYTAQGRSTVLL